MLESFLGMLSVYGIIIGGAQLFRERRLLR